MRRSTDYVSGVFLATPLALWRSLGGFDLTFAPAYYEDTDYCLRVWAAGFTVVYEPSVLVEHLDQTVLLDEREQHDGLPQELLAVEVQGEIFREEVDYS